MISHRNQLVVLIIFCLCLSACSLGIPGLTKNDPEPEEPSSGVSVIALMPVESNTADERTLQMLRMKLGEELRFKGYPQVATDLIDSRLSTLAEGKETGGEKHCHTRPGSGTVRCGWSDVLLASGRYKIKTSVLYTGYRDS